MLCFLYGPGEPGTLYRLRHVSSMAMIESEYANTDFDLKSTSSFDNLHRELAAACCLLHYTQGDDGDFHACFESDHDGESKITGAERDIMLMVDAIRSLSLVARAELDACHLREFNIGFHCGDTWAFTHSIPHRTVSAASDVGCSIGVTLYPSRHPDGTQRM